MGLEKARHNPWTRDEHILAFNLYCKIPFGTIHMRNPRVIELARLIGRTPGAVSYKLANFSRLDQEQQARGIKGLQHGSKGEVEIWHDFHEDPETLAYESERLFASITDQAIERLAEIDEAELPREGIERERLVRLRVNQNFFRTAVLAAYNYRCCITGLAVPELLVASHIVPWAADAKNRMNPRNGLCLNALHDRAFDRGLMTISSDATVCFCPSVRIKAANDDTGRNWLVGYQDKCIELPQRFRPEPSLLAEHRKRHMHRFL